MKLRTLQRLVRNAALHLDTLKPGWASDVDVNLLNIGSCSNCVMGQVYFKEAYEQNKDDMYAYSDKTGFEMAPSEFRNGKFSKACDPNGGNDDFVLVDSNGKHADCSEREAVLNRLWKAQIKPRRAIIDQQIADAEAKAELELAHALASPPQIVTMREVLICGKRYLDAGKLGAQSGDNGGCRYDYEDENGSRCVAGTAFSDYTIIKCKNLKSHYGDCLNEVGLDTLRDETGKCIIIIPDAENSDMQKFQNAHDRWARAQGKPQEGEKKTEFLLLFGQLQERYKN